VARALRSDHLGREGNERTAQRTLSTSVFYGIVAFESQQSKEELARRRPVQRVGDPFGV
jgi:hypothetical protein